MCADMHLPHTPHVLALQMQKDATLQELTLVINCMCYVYR